MSLFARSRSIAIVPSVPIPKKRASESGKRSSIINRAIKSDTTIVTAPEAEAEDLEEESEKESEEDMDYNMIKSSMITMKKNNDENKVIQKERGQPKWRKWLGQPNAGALDSLRVICAHCDQALRPRQIPYSSKLELVEFVELKRDRETDEFLMRSSRRPQIYNVAKAAMCTKLRQSGKSLTEANAMLGRGKMFVLSEAHADFLVKECLGDDVDELRNTGSYLDIGCGEGEVTQKLARYFGSVVTTESSPQMAKRCADLHPEWTVIETDKISDVFVRAREQNEDEDAKKISRKSTISKQRARAFFANIADETNNHNINNNDAGKFDCVGMFNVLDRCDKPFTMLQEIRNLLKPETGLLVIAVVLPFRPFVELDDGRRRQPTEKLPIATPSSSWEAGVTDLFEVFEQSGFKVLKFARVPYICEGDHLAGAYILDDAVFVLKRVQ